METKKILLNSIQTPDGTILTSRHVHDFVSYKDKNGQTYIVDGGTDYLKRMFDKPDFKELSKYDDGKHSTRRKYLYWGQNFDKNMKRLKETKWVPIKDLTTDHIEAILKTQTQIDPLYKETFRRELIYRDNKNI